MLHRLLFLTCLMALTSLTASAQWQQTYEELMSMDADDDIDDSQRENDYELLEQLAEHPLDLNKATREELELLPFLSAQQVMDIMEYLDHYGPMRSLGELRMVRSLDYVQLRLLPFFVFVSQEPEDSSHSADSRLSSLLTFPKHTLTATGQIPFYERKGDRNGYLGYRYRHSLRYEYSSGGDRLKAVLIGAQDAGEPFLAGNNKWGYDVYSYFVQARQLGALQNIVLGKYKIQTGMGLILGHSFSLGKTTMLQNNGRGALTLRGHSSRSESDYFQGAGATLGLTKHISLTAFASWRPIDATLTTDGEAATLITSGYHRTPTEMQKKYNTHQTAVGGSMGYRNGALQFGLNAVYTCLDRSLEPDRDVLYRHYQAHGQDFLNISMNYSYTHHRFALSGETATDKDGHIATINTLSLRATERATLTAVQRFYSMRYTTLHGHSFSDGGHVQNESGFYLGATWNPLRRIQLQAYADYAYFPWARYLVSQSSHSWDFMIQSTYLPNKHWTAQLRYRAHLRQRDNAKKTELLPNNSHQARAFVSYDSQQGWTLKTQAAFSRAFYKQPSHGWMISQHASLSYKKIQGHLTAALFKTDSYQSRIYVYEHQLAHEFSFPSFYGHGLRLALQTRVDLNRHLRLSARLGYTNYFDRSTIGNGLQQIDHSSMTDLNFQVRWRF